MKTLINTNKTTMTILHIIIVISNIFLFAYTILNYKEFDTFVSKILLIMIIDVLLIINNTISKIQPIIDITINGDITTLKDKPSIDINHGQRN